MLMVNLGFSFTTLLGLLDIVGGVGYFAITIGSIAKGAKKTTSSLNTILKVFELLLCPACLFFSGIILIFNGWRLDPILQFQQFLLHIVIWVAIAKKVYKLINS